MPEGPDTVDAWCMLSYVAARTSKIQIGTCVTPIPFRPPAQLAKIVSTVDILSKGRTILGVGAGWHQPEFDADGNKTKAATVTVLHNGVLVQDNTEIQGTTEYIGKPKNPAHGEGPIKLQDHGNPVSFRNIWVRKL